MEPLEEHAVRLHAMLSNLQVQAAGQGPVEEEPLPVEIAWESVEGHEDQASPPEASMVVSYNAALPDQTSLAPSKQIQTTCRCRAPSKCLYATHLEGNSSKQHMLDAILGNQEALQMVLKNQNLLKSLVDNLQKTVDNLQKTVSTIDGRLRVMEQDTGFLAQFSQELKNETTWG